MDLLGGDKGSVSDQKNEKPEKKLSARRGMGESDPQRHASDLFLLVEEPRRTCSAPDNPNPAREKSYVNLIFENL